MEKPRKMSKLEKGIAALGNAAVLAGVLAATQPDNDIDATSKNPIDKEPLRAESSESGYIDSKQQLSSRVVVNKPGENTPRPVSRPERQLTLADFTHSLYLLDYLTMQEAERLGVDPLEFRTALDTFFFFLADVESDFRPDARNAEGSSAKGYYQYLTDNNDPGLQNGSIHTSINRVYTLLERHGLVSKGQHSGLSWADALYIDTDLILDIPIEEQQIMVFADLIQRRGTDELLRQLVSKDPKVVREAALRLYYMAHHTAPDAKTISNAERKADEYYKV